MKGILFGGCSFTWGQGLYFYSDLENLPYGSQNYGFNYKDVSEAMLNFKNANRYPRLVANYFKTFEVTKNDSGKLYGNGGSEDETFMFFDFLFNVERKYKYNDFDYIIIQLSNIWRNDFIFELDDVMYKTKVKQLYLYDNIEKEILFTEELEKFCNINNYNFDDLHKLMINQQFKRLKEQVIYYSKKNIKVKIISWINDFVNLIKNDEMLSECFIEMDYDGKSFTTIQELMDYEKTFEIEYDLKIKKNILCEDKHPSLSCHQVIANSIIKNLKLIK